MYYVHTLMSYETILSYWLNAIDRLMDLIDEARRGNFKRLAVANKASMPRFLYLSSFLLHSESR